jgi:hypothetical protein
MMTGSSMTRSLLHIGYTKAGSSYLQSWFAAHPELLYTHQALHGFRRTPEISTFAHEAPADPVYAVTSDEDLAFWKGPLEPLGLEMRAYDVGGHQRRVCNLLHDLFPHATVLIVTRGFASVIGSAYGQYVRAGGRLDLPELREATGKLMIEFWNYDFLIDLYREKFGAANVIVLPYELLRRDSAAFLSHLAARLGLTHRPHPAERVNPALDPRVLGRIRRLSRMLLGALRPLPLATRRRLYVAYTRLLAGERLVSWLGLGLGTEDASAAALSTPDDFLARFRGLAARLCREAAYADFAAEYLETARDAAAPELREECPASLAMAASPR